MQVDVTTCAASSASVRVALKYDVSPSLPSSNSDPTLATADLSDAYMSDASTLEGEGPSLLQLHRREPSDASSEGSGAAASAADDASQPACLDAKSYLSSTSSTGVLKAGSSFEWVSNEIFDERSRTHRSTAGPVCHIYRGDKLRETMCFRIHAPVRGMRYEVHTYKRIFGRFVFFHKTSTQMGDFEAREEPYSFVFPSNAIPRLVPGICGEYKAIQIVRAAGEKEPIFLREAETKIG